MGDQWLFDAGGTGDASMISFPFREFIQDNYARASLDSILSQLNALLSRSFDDEGDLIVATPSGIVPVGAMLEWGAAAAPEKWLICDGSQINRVTYKSLFEVLGTTYGVGDGSTTFNLPDFRQRLALGKAASGTGASLGDTGGDIDHTHSSGSHSHTYSGTTSTDGTHNHSGVTGDNGSHDHSFTTGSDNAQCEAIARNDAIYSSFVIAALGSPVGGGHQHGGTTNGVGDHAHSINSDGSHGHTYSGTTSSTASGTTGTANPPFLVVHKIIYAGV
jgi:microcystin-dependent protein